MALVLVFCCASGILWAQITSATLSGTVTDTTGAVVPNAKVVLKNSGSGVEREAVSNGVGFFNFAAVVPGSYTVKVSAPGFETWKLSEFDIHPGDSKALPNIGLRPGAESVSVEVNASVGGIIQDSGELGALITTQDMKRLATQGRSATELIKMLPGIAIQGSNGNLGQGTYDPSLNASYNSAANAYASNGQPGGSMQVTSDGANIIDPGNMGGGTQTLNMDMVQEVKVQTGAYGADSERGPTVVNAIGKSGTERFHGEGYMVARTYHLNSNLAQSKSTTPFTPRVEDRYLYPGFNVGGPILIPGTSFNRKEPKAFFWAGYEYYNQQFPGQRVESIVPTAGMRAGNFSQAELSKLCANLTPGGVPFGYTSNGTPVNGAPSYCNVPNYTVSGKKFANGDLATALGNNFDAAKAFFNMMPLPNATPANNNNPYNYINQLMMEQNGWEFHARGDYGFTPSQKLYVTYNRQSDSVPTPVMMWWYPSKAVPYAGNVTNLTRSHTVTINETSILNATTTNEFIASLAYLDNPYNLGSPNAVSRKALNFPYQGLFKNGTDQMPGIQNWENNGLPQIYMPGFVNNTLKIRKLDYSLQDNFSKVIGTHALKAGVFFERAENNQHNPGSYSNGYYTFSPGIYNTGVATPENGNAANANGCSNSTSGSPNANPVCFNAAANILMGLPDSFNQVNFISQNNMFYRTLAFYVQDSWKATRRLSLTAGVRFEHLGPWLDAHNVGFAVWNAQTYGAQVGSSQFPGITWHGKDKSVSNSGFADYPQLYYLPRFGIAYDLFGNGKTSLRGGWGAYRFQDSFNAYAGALSPGVNQQSASTGNRIMSMSQVDAMAVTAGGYSSDQTVYVIDPKDQERPVTYDYNFTISQQMPWNSVFQIGYVGNMSRNLMLPSPLQNANAMPAGALFKAYCNPFYPQLSQAGCKPLPSGVTKYTNLSITQQDALRPYPFYNKLYAYKHGAYTNYDGLQIQWNRQKGRLAFGVNYTWSKLLGITNTNDNIVDPINVDANYGYMPNDRSHILNLSYSYQEGQKFHVNRFVSGFVNNWEISGITGWQSGSNLQAVNTPNFGLGGTVISNGQNADIDGAHLLGSPDYKVMPVVLCDPRSGTSHPTRVNGSCFGIPNTTGASFRNGSYNVPYIHGPAWFNSDLSMTKAFRVTEGQSLRFRISAFNFLNHPLVAYSNGSNLTLSYSQANPAGGAASPASMTNSVFGRPNYEIGRRVMAVEARYSF